MNPISEVDRYSPEQLDRLHDAANLHAEFLRHAAIDDFWHGLAHGWSTQQQRAGRAAERLASSLARHVRRRSAAAQGCRDQAC